MPQLILSQIFELIQTALYKSNGRRSRNSNLLEKWYIQDENSIPAVHVLRREVRLTQKAISKHNGTENVIMNEISFVN